MSTDSIAENKLLDGLNRLENPARTCTSSNLPCGHVAIRQHNFCVAAKVRLSLFSLPHKAFTKKLAHDFRFARSLAHSKASKQASKASKKASKHIHDHFAGKEKKERLIEKSLYWCWNINQLPVRTRPQTARKAFSLSHMPKHARKRKKNSSGVLRSFQGCLSHVLRTDSPTSH